MKYQTYIKHTDGTGMKTIKTYGSKSLCIRVKEDGSLRFFYRSESVGFAFECSLLCEVGEPYQIPFKELMSAHSLTLGKQMEFDVRPWMADTLAK